MADITMCDNTLCEKKEECYRFKAVPCKYTQSYFTGIPPKDEDGNCNYFWNIKYERWGISL